VIQSKTSDDICFGLGAALAILRGYGKTLWADRAISNGRWVMAVGVGENDSRASASGGGGLRKRQTARHVCLAGT